MDTVSVQVHDDFLVRVSKVRKPILAIAELIWNGFDADAMQVSVTFEVSELGSVTEIRVRDNGIGVDHDIVRGAFGNLGNSQKKGKSKTVLRNRLLHGKVGRGRFYSFSLGYYVLWNTVYRKGEKLYRYTVSGDLSRIGTFEISDPEEVMEGETGTEVVVRDIYSHLPSLLSDNALSQITEQFAKYLCDYPDVSLVYNAKTVDGKQAIKETVNFTLSDITLHSGEKTTAEVNIIEWANTSSNTLVLCDENGSPVYEASLSVHTLGYDCSVYVKSDIFRILNDDNSLLLEYLDPDIRQVVDAAKDTVRSHFKDKTTKAAVDVITKLKQQDIYPYKGEPATPLESAERQMFDLLAYNVDSYLTNFDKIDNRQRKLSMRLLKQTMETSPSDVLRILQDVLDLPKDKQTELTELLSKTSLTSIINAAKIVADRLKFLHALELLVFDPVSKKTLLERSQLHKILAEHTWIFGEEFNLTVNDKSLNAVLKKHLHLLGRKGVDGSDVMLENGKHGIVDMMLSRRVPHAKAEELEHIIIELKRPSQTLNDEVVTQIRNYAFAVAEDERFTALDTSWHFWAISNEVTKNVRRQARISNLPDGMIYQNTDDKIFIWVRTWSQIIESCRARLTFYKDKLDYEVDDESALEYLRKTHQRYLPDCWKNEAK